MKVVGRSEVCQQALKAVQEAARNKSNVILWGEKGVGRTLLARVYRKTSPLGGKASTLSGLSFADARFGDRWRELTSRVVGQECTFLEISEFDRLAQLGRTVVTQFLAGRKVRSWPLAWVLTSQVDPDAISHLDELDATRVFLPPLRERREDIADLASHFVQRIANSYRITTKPLDSGAMERLESMPFSDGNAFELYALLENAYAACSGTMISARDLQTPDASLAAESRARMFLATLSRMLPMDVWERLSVEEALRRAGGHSRKAAEIAGFPPSTFYRKVSQYGLKRPRTDDSGASSDRQGTALAHGDL